VMETKILLSKVAGVTFEGRQDVIEAMHGNEAVQLRPEPQNQYDANAIAVWVAFPPESGMEAAHIGYLPKEIAAQVAPHMDGESLMGWVDEITGGFRKWDGSIASYGVIVRVELPNGD